MMASVSLLSRAGQRAAPVVNTEASWCAAIANVDLGQTALSLA